ncbi:MAG: hypothetical protein KME05_16015 [Gloeocapsa sp. UFS-A4-WI-NPMV-4B04]|jgi:hypothetical protein|nr:hypothetical protein [Gloeocapsa sp. UFS-A4-WI-NPMV-4B04]
MLTFKKGFHQLKTLGILVLAVSLASCSDGNEITNNPTDSASTPPASSVNSASSQTTDSPATVAIPGVKDVGEITFRPASRNTSGFFDSINGSNTSRIEVEKATPLTATGWAVLTNEGKTPDSVIVTYGNNNSVVAVAPVNLNRPDIVKALKNPGYKNSGWSATFNSSALPAEPVVLRAWAYNAAAKEATPLSKSFEVVLN